MLNFTEDAPGESLAERSTRAIYQEIRKQGLRKGDSLPSEAALGEFLGVSRGVVREAIRALAALHVVDIGNGRRPRVGAVDASTLAILIDHAIHTEQVDVRHVLDVRRSLEARSVALAAVRRSEREAEEIAEHAAAMRRAHAEGQSTTAHDLAFHRAIAQASRNPMFHLIICAFSAVVTHDGPIGWQTRPKEGDLLDLLDCHDAIAAAILARDPEAAEATMAAHFDVTMRALIASGAA